MARYGIRVGRTLDVSLKGTDLKPQYSLSNYKYASIDVDGNVTVTSYCKKFKVKAVVEGKKYSTTIFPVDPYIYCKDSVKVGKKLSLKVKQGLGESTYTVKNITGKAYISGSKLVAEAPGTVEITAENFEIKVTKTISIY